MENGKLIIGFTGTARAGKDTCAALISDLVSQYNDAPGIEMTEMYPVVRETFAGPLKSMVAMLMDFYGIGSIMDKSSTWEYIEGSKKEEVIPEIGASPRKLMQTLGTDWGRTMIKDSLWVDSMKIRLAGYDEAAKMGYKGVVILVTDVRFDNEAQAIKDAGGIIIRVVREQEAQVPAHASENGVSAEYLDHVIANNGTMEQLRGSMQNVLDTYLPEVTKVLEALREAEAELPREGAM